MSDEENDWDDAAYGDDKWDDDDDDDDEFTREEDVTNITAGNFFSEEPVNTDMSYAQMSHTGGDMKLNPQDPSDMFKIKLNQIHLKVYPNTVTRTFNSDKVLSYFENDIKFLNPYAFAFGYNCITINPSNNKQHILPENVLKIYNEFININWLDDTVTANVGPQDIFRYARHILKKIYNIG